MLLSKLLLTPDWMCPRTLSCNQAYAGFAAHKWVPMSKQLILLDLLN